jgi:hypothetical protein
MLVVAAVLMLALTLVLAAVLVFVVVDDAGAGRRCWQVENAGAAWEGLPRPEFSPPRHQYKHEFRPIPPCGPMQGACFPAPNPHRTLHFR